MHILIVFVFNTHAHLIIIISGGGGGGGLIVCKQQARGCGFEAD